MPALEEETREASRGHHYPLAEGEELWPSKMPPPLEAAASNTEETAETGTLEERILHKYTPGKLALDAHAAPAPADPAAHANAGDESNSSVKACPACMGLGKVGRPPGGPNLLWTPSRR
jgi:hypothetical protein